MAEEIDKGNFSSGLSETMVQRLLQKVLTDWRIQECIAAIREGKRADIGYFVRSAKPFYAADGAPTLAGFEPSFILEGDGSLGRPSLGKADAARMQTMTSGFVAGAHRDLREVGNVERYFRTLLETFGPVTLAPRFTPTLSRSVPFLRADPTTLSKPPVNTAYNGRDVVVCVIDQGCDFAHRNFRKGADNANTRLKFLAVVPQIGVPTKHSAGTINTWLAAADPYSVYNPNADGYNCDPVGNGGTHGTLVLDIAAGNGNGTGLPGMAPNADLCFIQPYISESRGRRFISGEAIVKCIDYAIVELGLNATGNTIPAVFNVSLGTNDGPHDSVDHGALIDGGAVAWNITLESYFAAKPGRSLIWSAGNQYLGNLHATGRIRAGAPATFDIRIPKGDQRANNFQIWFDKPINVTVDVRAMLADYKGAPTPYTPSWQASGALQDEDATPRAAGHLHAAAKYGATDELYVIKGWLTPPLARTPTTASDADRWETWRIEVSGTSIAAFDFKVDAWMERDDADQASFRQPHLAAGTDSNTAIEPLGSLSANAAGIGSAIVVGAVGAATYVPTTPVDPPPPGVGDIMPFSSAGPTRKGAQRPDVCAPGEIIRGAQSRGDPFSTGQFGPVGTIIASGTSMAAPHVAGLVALYFDKLKRGGTALSAFPVPDTMRKLLRDKARPTLPGSTTPQWDPRRGYGIVDAVNLLKP